MNDIVMPKLSDTMTEGRLVAWKKRVGDTVRRGEVLAEVETDKANMELESFTAGVLLEIRVQPGEMAAVGTVIAVIGKPEEKGAATQQAGGAAPEQPAQPEQQKKEQPAQAEQQKTEAQPQPTQPRSQPQPPQAAQQPEKQPAQEAPETAPPSAAKGKEAGEAEMKMATAKPGGEGESQAPAAPLAKPGETQAPAQPKEGAAETRAPAPQGGGQPSGAPGEGAAFRERAAPVVRRRARELGVDLSKVQGTGPEGRILLQDLESHAAPSQAEQKAPAAKPAAPEAAGPGAREEAKPMPRLRAAVAKIVTESWKSIPHFTVTMDIAMDEADSIRRQLKESGKGVTLNDLLVKGVALALLKFPQVNASYAGETVRYHDEINIGVAVGVRDGVLVPVIRSCQQLSLLGISLESRKLVERARAGSLSEQEMSGGTFSISNMGMYGVTQFNAIIYPNQAAVLAVGALMDTVVMRCGVPACVKIMKVTLSADHRVIDGALAAEFLAHLKRIMENPVQLLI
jgi:pyruvate dehydrogenase E2 component (dihydrolipoamide acetyltransferase)